MARKNRDQLTILQGLGFEEDQWRERDHLERPFTREERRAFGKLYAANIGLAWKFTAKMSRKFPVLERDVISSLVDVAFLRTFRSYDPTKLNPANGEPYKLSTLLGRFVEGEIMHYLRDHGFQIAAPPVVRERGSRARKLAAAGLTPQQVTAELGITMADLQECLLATSGIGHDVQDWELHCDQRPSPMEWLEAEEEREAAAVA
jgi:DNA-directed RNA polymerase specialized sigma subunit